MKKVRDKRYENRRKRRRRVRARFTGTVDRPRMSVHRSLKNISVQFIDDDSARTLASVSTLSARFKENYDKGGGSVESASHLGKLAAETAAAAGIEKVVFDRGGYKYHGRIKALADAAREAGLKF